MSTRSRRLIPGLLLVLIVLSAACGSATQTPSPSPSATSTTAPSAAGSEAATAPSDGPPAGTQTDTAWGRIWDDVPPGFPRYPGSAIADDASPDPVSATFAVADDDTAVIAAWMQEALETATFSTESLSGPFEDGSFVLESVGDGDCRLQVVVAPMGTMTFVIVRYGAACPHA